VLVRGKDTHTHHTHSFSHKSFSGLKFFVTFHFKDNESVVTRGKIFENGLITRKRVLGCCRS
jgi:hypothetical protein